MGAEHEATQGVLSLFEKMFFPPGDERAQIADRTFYELLATFAVANKFSKLFGPLWSIEMKQIDLNRCVSVIVAVLSIVHQLQKRLSVEDTIELNKHLDTIAEKAGLVLPLTEEGMKQFKQAVKIG